MDPVDVTSVQVLGHYRLLVGFSDGTKRTVSLRGHLHGPVFEPLRDATYFAQVRVDPEIGTITWPNGADIAPEALYTDYGEAAPVAQVG
ncbi:MAG: DUF2442 domain-containing protein [Candidatus Dormibacteraeota bacterium]|jgi:hypothetical protein|nr:DUF2442 domain-containing protein [Candidatus Dormibacteraeota bacterium]